MLIISPKENALIDRMAMRQAMFLFALVFIVAGCVDLYHIWQDYLWGPKVDMAWIKLLCEAIGKFAVATIIGWLASAGMKKDVALDQAYVELHQKRGF